MKRLFSLGCVVVLGAALLGAAWYLASQIPTVSRQLPRNSAPLLVSLTKPKEGAAYPVLGALPVSAEAFGSVPVDRLELWADGVLVQTFPSPIQGLAVLDNTWTWTPKTLGDHTLYARAVDSLGRDAMSNVVHLKAVADPGLVVIKTARSNDTPEKLAQTYHTTAAQILAANADLKAGSPIPAGQDVIIPIAPESVPPAPVTSSPPPTSTNGFKDVGGPPLPDSSADPAPPGSPNNVVWWFQKNVIGQLTTIQLPAAPTLQGSAQNCSAHLYISDHADNESGFFVYRLDPHASAFARIAALDAHNGSPTVVFDDENLSGAYQYYVAAYNPAGERAGNVIAISINAPACAVANPIVRLSDLVSANTDGLELAYLYIAVNGGRWTRVPQDKTGFLDLQTPLHLAEIGALVLPGQTPMKTMSGEAWGWRGGALVSLGTFSKDVSGVASAAGPSSNLLPLTTLEARGVPNPSTADYNWVKEMSYGTLPELANATFRWSAAGDITQGKWQVSVQSYAADPALDPPGLLLTGDAPEPETPGKPVQFTIDLSSLAPPAANQSAGNVKATVKLPPFAPVFQPAASPNNPPQVLLKSPLIAEEQNGSTQQKILLFNPNLTDLAKFGINTFYVRVLPMNGSQVVGEPSNTVVVHYDSTAQQVPVIPASNVYNVGYDVKILKFTPTNFADSKYEFCVKVLKNPYYPTNFVDQPLWAGIAPGETACPLKKVYASQSGIGAALEDLGNLIESGVDFVKGLYDDLDALVKKWAAKLNPLCITAKFATDAAGKGGGTVDDVCNKVASIAVDAAKMYAGLPPSLPDFNEIKNLGKDYLVDLAAEQLGADCPQECKDLISQGLDYTLDQLKQSQGSPTCIDKQAANDNGLEPLCPPEGVQVEPDPRGQYAPALLSVQLTRPPLSVQLSPDAKVKACGLDVSNTYDNQFWVGKQLLLPVPYGAADLNWKGTPLSGQLFKQTSMPVPVIEPGKSISLTVALDYPRGLAWDKNGFEIWGVEPWLPGHQSLWKNHWDVPDMYVWMHDWFAKYHGAHVTVTASTCQPGESDQIKAGPLVEPDVKQYYGSP